MSRMCLQFLRSRNSRIQPLDSTWIIPVPLLVLTALLLLFCGSAQSQTQNGNILGTVRDPSGAAVPGVKLTASQQETGTTRDTTSGPDGDYRFALLPFGDYTVTAEASGFKKFIKGNVHLATNQTLRVDVNLEVGEKTEEVTVTAEAAPITTDTGEISATQDPEFLKNHPGTHWNRAWMVASSTISATEGYGTFYGEPIDHTAATQDGIEYDQWNHLVYDYTVEEVKADVLNAPAKYQKSANINTVTRGGTNSFHGRAEIQIDNEIFWASFPRVHADQCTPLRACVGRWRAGMVVGGPLIIPHVYNGKNKTF